MLTLEKKRSIIIRKIIILLTRRTIITEDNMIALQIFLLIVGLVLLVKGADWFVDGGAGVAKKCKISPLIVGLTIVAFGTSAPELAVSVTSAIAHSTDLAISNVVGSNIINILLILGLSAVLHKLPVQKNSLYLDLPVLILSSSLIIILGYFGGAVEWWDGLVLIALFGVYMFVLIKKAVKEIKKPVETVNIGEAVGANTESVSAGNGGAETDGDGKAEKEKTPKSKLGVWYERQKEKVWFLIILIVVGIGMIVGGGTLLVNAATAIATRAGVSERVIGLTIVAIGTSLPELVTSVIAAFKGETDIAVGNIIGSNIFNILLIAGISSLFFPLSFSFSNLIDATVALVAATLLLLFSLPKNHNLGKLSGIIMLAGFAGYYVYLFVG